MALSTHVPPDPVNLDHLSEFLNARRNHCFVCPNGVAREIVSHNEVAPNKAMKMNDTILDMVGDQSISKRDRLKMIIAAKKESRLK